MAEGAGSSGQGTSSQWRPQRRSSSLAPGIGSLVGAKGLGSLGFSVVEVCARSRGFFFFAGGEDTT